MVSRAKTEFVELGCGTGSRLEVSTETVNVPSPCTRERKISTRVHLMHANLLSVFACCNIVRAFTGICLGDSIPQCKHKQAMTKYVNARIREYTCTQIFKVHGFIDANVNIT